MRIVVRTAAVLLFGSIAVAAQAAHIDIVLDPFIFYDEVEPAPATPEEITSVAYGSGRINLRDYGNPDSVTVLAGASWWNGNQDVVYSTTTRGIEISFSDLSVVGFTFRIAANQAARAWVQAFSAGSLANDTGWFGGVGPDRSRGVGVYAAAGSGACIDRIVVDPTFVWGIGDFTIATDANCNAEAVPIPPAIALFLTALAGFGVWGRRNRSAASRR